MNNNQPYDIPNCPYCGGEAVILPDDLVGKIAVCKGCGAIEDLKVWQRRANEKEKG